MTLRGYPGSWVARGLWPLAVQRSVSGTAGPPPATEQQVRAHAGELIALTARHGINGLALASPGRLHGTSARAGTWRMYLSSSAPPPTCSAEVMLFSDGALRNEHVSPDLVTATPL